MKQKGGGFTIAELLVVIVVIAILVTIVGVGYNGTITDSKNKGAKANAYIIQKKLDAYLAGTGSYPMPTDTTIAAVTADLNSRVDSSIASSGLYLIGGAGSTGWDTSNADPTKSPANATKVSYCTAPTPDPALAGAYKLEYFDYKANAAAATFITRSLGTQPCTTWQPLT